MAIITCSLQRIDEITSLPVRDPYREIYLQRTAWWGLCEEHFINPENKAMNKIQQDNDWNVFEDTINNKVRKFIENLRGNYHSNTWMFYGNDGERFPSYDVINWKAISSVKYKSTDSHKITQAGVIFYPPDVNNQTTRIAGFITADDTHQYKNLLFQRRQRKEMERFRYAVPFLTRRV
ncbi:hypothetical protein ACVRTC_003454 [Cronobacter sakazakii]|nr:hypothetical protein [Cronobacter sakazakii]ELY4392796.1 hypothetical protein [Cronobacter sakazakii]